MNRLERLVSIARKPTRRVIGLMSGTSVDGIDAALTEIDGHGGSATVRLVDFRTYPFPPEMRSRIFRLFDPASARIDQICNLDFLLGELFAAAVNHLLHEVGMKPEEIDIVGSAGQTIWHDPQPVREAATVEWMDGPL